MKIEYTLLKKEENTNLTKVTVAEPTLTWWTVNVKEL